MISLLTDATTDGSSGVLKLAAGHHDGGDTPLTGTLYVWGTFDGATAVLELSPDGSAWFQAEDLTFTAKGVTKLEVEGHSVRGTLQNAGAATQVSMRLFTPEFWPTPA